MSARYDIIAAVMRLAALTESDWQTNEGFPDPWYIQLCVDRVPLYKMTDKVSPSGPAAWTKQDYHDMWRAIAHEPVLRPIDYEVLKGPKLRYPYMMPSDQPASIKQGGTYYWKLQL